MAESLELQDALFSMKCCLCQNVLSVPPIIAISEDGKQLKCGRCKNVKKPFNARNFALENVLKFHSFPCIYDDCNEMIPWEDVERHEEICEKKTITCPIHYQECGGIVLKHNLERHMEQNHSSNMHFGCFTSILKLNRVGIYFVISNNQQFLVMIKNINISEVYVTSLNNNINECFTYNLKLSNIPEDSYSLSIENQPINKYEEQNHCSKCFSEECDLIHHPHSTVNESVSVNVDCKKINLTRMLPVFGNEFGNISEMKYTITFHPKKDNEKKKEELVSLKPTVNSTVDFQRSSEASQQCRMCKEYMKDNIEECKAKKRCHVSYDLCSKCTLKLRVCPKCPHWYR